MLTSPLLLITESMLQFKMAIVRLMSNLASPAQGGQTSPILVLQSPEGKQMT